MNLQRDQDPEELTSQALLGLWDHGVRMRNGRLAVQILALGDSQLAERLAAHRQEMARSVERKSEMLERVE